MTMFSAAPQSSRCATARGHMSSRSRSAASRSLGAVALVAYLLWPTWGSGGAMPGPAAGERRRHAVQRSATAIRMKIQRHSGPQERIDLDFLYPSLEPPGAPKHVTADTVEEAMQPIDRVFLSISAHHDALAPEQRTPRSIRAISTRPRPGADGLTMRISAPTRPMAARILFRRKPRADRTLHARCRHARHVPFRTPCRRRRSHLPFSAELAVAMARCRGSAGPAVSAIARTEGLTPDRFAPH